MPFSAQLVIQWSQDSAFGHLSRAQATFQYLCVQVCLFALHQYVVCSATWAEQLTSPGILHVLDVEGPNFWQELDPIFQLFSFFLRGNYNIIRFFMVRW